MGFPYETTKSYSLLAGEQISQPRLQVGVFLLSSPGFHPSSGGSAVAAAVMTRKAHESHGNPSPTQKNNLSSIWSRNNIF